MKTEVATLKSEVAASKSEVAALKFKVAASKSEVAASKSEVAALRKEKEEYQWHVKEQHTKFVKELQSFLAKEEAHCVENYIKIQDVGFAVAKMVFDCRRSPLLDPVGACRRCWSHCRLEESQLLESPPPPGGVAVAALRSRLERSRRRR
ncbi:hypothetical protein Droror1_Dr00027754 [Drosera rotundifolia]